MERLSTTDNHTRILCMRGEAREGVSGTENGVRIGKRGGRGSMMTILQNMLTVLGCYLIGF